MQQGISYDQVTAERYHISPHLGANSMRKQIPGSIFRRNWSFAEATRKTKTKEGKRAFSKTPITHQHISTHHAQNTTNLTS